jgi:hypothetical protein
VFKATDFNGDEKIGLEEALQLIQFIRAMREAHVWP